MRLVIANCSVDYQGRLTAHLPMATRLLLIKADGCISIHIGARLSATAEYLFSSTEGVLSGRVASWRTLLGWIAEHPWQTLFGIGYKTLPYTDYLGAPIVADNMYLSLLVETGIASIRRTSARSTCCAATPTVAR